MRLRGGGDKIPAMAEPVLFGCVSGFLGAGKTTALAAAARTLVARGLSVGLVANDQGRDLVDTAVFRGLGLPAAEIAGGCFCCRFDELVAEADRLLAEHPVDVLLAEAVGSCTDLVATVYRPLRRFFPDQFRLAPFSVLVEPGRLGEMTDGGAHVPPDVSYLFGRQIAEAELVVLTKVDLVGGEERRALRCALGSMAPGVPVLETSAVSGLGVGEWVDLLLGEPSPASAAIEVDYERYARGEAALAWLNAALQLRAARGLSPRGLGELLLVEIRERARGRGLFLPHVKILVASSRGSARVALTRADGSFDWSGDPDLPAEPGLSVILNARAATSPEDLREVAAEAIAHAARQLGAAFEVDRVECFSPPRPVPRHRLAAETPGGS